MIIVNCQQVAISADRSSKAIAYAEDLQPVLDVLVP